MLVSFHLLNKSILLLLNSQLSPIICMSLTMPILPTLNLTIMVLLFLVLVFTELVLLLNSIGVPLEPLELCVKTMSKQSWSIITQKLFPPIMMKPTDCISNQSTWKEFWIFMTWNNLPGLLFLWVVKLQTILPYHCTDKMSRF